jgi:hypothetical protein
VIAFEMTNIDINAFNNTFTAQFDDAIVVAFNSLATQLPSIHLPLSSNLPGTKTAGYRFNILSQGEKVIRGKNGLGTQPRARQIEILVGESIFSTSLDMVSYLLVYSL